MEGFSEGATPSAKLNTGLAGFSARRFEELDWDKNGQVSLPLSLFLTFTLLHSLSLSLSLTFTLLHSLSYIHTHTLSLSPCHSPALSLTLLLSFFLLPLPGLVQGVPLCARKVAGDRQGGRGGRGGGRGGRGDDGGEEPLLLLGGEAERRMTRGE